MLPTKDEQKPVNDPNLESINQTKVVPEKDANLKKIREMTKKNNIWVEIKSRPYIAATTGLIVGAAITYAVCRPKTT